MEEDQGEGSCLSRSRPREATRVCVCGWVWTRRSDRNEGGIYAAGSGTAGAEGERPAAGSAGASSGCFEAVGEVGTGVLAAP